jgi:hypothetical protein
MIFQYLNFSIVSLLSNYLNMIEKITIDYVPTNVYEIYNNKHEK